MTIKIGDKVKRVGYSEWPHQFGKEGEVYEVLKVNNNGIVVIEGMPTASASAFEKVYTTPEGTIVNIGDKGVWEGVVYTLVGGPDPYGVEQPYWNGRGESSWNPLTTEGYTILPNNTQQTKEEPTMTATQPRTKGAMFTETKTTTVIKEVINGRGPNGSYVSIKPDGFVINLVIGASWHNRCAEGFSKKGLTELIEELTAVRDCMGN